MALLRATTRPTPIHVTLRPARSSRRLPSESACRIMRRWRHLATRRKGRISARRSNIFGRPARACARSISAPSTRSRACSTRARGWPSGSRSVGKRLIEAPQTLHPTTRAILTPGLKLSAVDAFEGTYRLKALRRDCEAILAEVDALCVPTISRFVTFAEIAADPIGPNARLGTYTDFVNLLDLCGIAVPTGERADGRPGGVTLLAAAGRDALCASLAAKVEAGRMGATDWVRPAMPDLPMPVGAGEIALAVCGAHMSGLPLNSELTGRGARLIRACRTAPAYRLYALAGGPPARPGLVKRAGGAAIPLEVWALPVERFGDFIAGVPSPLCIGTVELDDGTTVKGLPGARRMGWPAQWISPSMADGVHFWRRRAGRRRWRRSYDPHRRRVAACTWR